MRFSSNPHVVVVAGALEGIHALMRLINALPYQFPAPIVASVHGPCEHELQRIARTQTGISDRLTMVHAMDGDQLHLGRVYVAPASIDVAFTAKNLVRLMPSSSVPDQDGHPSTNADRLFKSAAQVYGAGAIGVVLSGRGKDGTSGLRAITDAGGTRIVQSPSEANHPAMPTHALMGDHVEFTVLLDEMGTLLNQLVAR
ncbi:MAG: hypothetical protein EOP14_03520 [Pseudomonas sp.]|nr:MAG: hypothetical protein EOP14_03520 [Pseudomonas sp.]